MNKNIKLAVAGAVLALSATAANAGIVIPAGDWTLDVSGNVNVYDIYNKSNGTTAINGGLAGTTHNTNATMNNGLLPNFLGFSGSTRQNDLDVAFTISLQPGTGTNSNVGAAATSGGNGAFSGSAVADNPGGINTRQMFITFGDKSWGSVKMGKDLGIFASDAILNDMTLLGVGAGGAAAGNTTLGRIGTGYIYADWKPQFAYTTPNFSGFQATAGITQAFQAATYIAGANTQSVNINAAPAYEGKASYSFAANDVTGKVWVSGLAQHQGAFVGYSNNDRVAYAGDIGANANVAGFGLTGYYYYGSGVGTTGQMLNGYGQNGATTQLNSRDSYGGYVQATYVLPTKTKVGISWGESKLDLADGENVSTTALIKTNEMWTAGVYHPLTKHLNLVAEYSYVQSKDQGGAKDDSNIGSIGAILFF